MKVVPRVSCIRTNVDTLDGISQMIFLAPILDSSLHLSQLS